jgi:hypothetical protein
MGEWNLYNYIKQILPMTYCDILIDAIKKQAELFLLDAGEFFPFATAIGQRNEVIPIGAYIEDENDRPQSQQLIDLLEKGIKKEIAEGRYLIAALAYDAFIYEGEQKFDVIIISFYESDSFVEKYFKYHIHKDYVEFI